MRAKYRCPFTHYAVFDCDGNPLSRESRTKLDHPDEAWALAVETVRLWPLFEEGLVVGCIGEIVVPLLRFRRNGPPGTQDVSFEMEEFPWVRSKGGV